MLMIFQYCTQQKTFLPPENLAELNKRLPKDIYSPRGEDYHYQRLDPIGFSIASCGPPAIRGRSKLPSEFELETGLPFL